MDTLAGYPGLPGLFVSGVFSASLSTLSSGFNALSAVTWDDFLKQSKYGKMSENKIKIMNKMTAAFYGILTIIMAFLVGQIGSVLQVTELRKLLPFLTKFLSTGRHFSCWLPGRATTWTLLDSNILSFCKCQGIRVNEITHNVTYLDLFVSVNNCLESTLVYSRHQSAICKSQVVLGGH